MKKRLDLLLVDQGLAESCTKAQALILAGQVFVGGQKETKSGTLIEENKQIFLKEKIPYVSRGALKLKKAAQEFKIDFSEKIVCDIGASTGGFTDFALQHKAKKVYAIDVGYGQLSFKLRQDPKVVVMERTNIKDVKSLPEKINIFLADVSFISLKKILPVIKILGQQKADILALIKPQFEVSKEIADKGKGVIKDKNIQEKTISDIKIFAQNLGFKVQGLVESPILGAKGNKEFFIYLKL